MKAMLKPAPGVFERALRIKLKEYMDRERITPRRKRMKHPELVIMWLCIIMMWLCTFAALNAR